MNIIMQMLLLALGFVLLVKGADWFVDGASGIAVKLRIPQLVTGLTIVAMGTAIRGGVTGVTTFVMLCVAPLNVVKGAMVSVLTMLLYKRVARPLFGIHHK